MKIRKFKLEDTEEIARLVKVTFKKFSKNDGSKKAVETYINKYNNLEKLKLKFKDSPIFYIAEDKEKIIGIIRGDENRIGNFFVLEKYQNQNIGSKLLGKFEIEAKRKGSKLIRIRSSLYAVPFYQRKGYKKSRGMMVAKNLFGLRYQPMIKNLE